MLSHIAQAKRLSATKIQVAIIILKHLLFICWVFLHSPLSECVVGIMINYKYHGSFEVFTDT